MVAQRSHEPWHQIPLHTNNTQDGIHRLMLGFGLADLDLAAHQVKGTMTAFKGTMTAYHMKVGVPNNNATSDSD